jgi:hypothetical protein
MQAPLSQTKPQEDVRCGQLASQATVLLELKMAS